LIHVEKKKQWNDELERVLKLMEIENKNFEGIVLGEYNGDDNKILKILFLLFYKNCIKTKNLLYKELKRDIQSRVGR
jgi:hypothetical protein